ncbi:MAG: hypothetical protein V9G04_05130 [Nocardioides sp.]|jgi:hypothetical protein
MRKFTAAVAATMVAAALTGPVLISGGANAAPTTGTAAKAKATSSLSFARGYQHYQQLPDKGVFKTKATKKGKVVLSANGKKFAVKKLKKGKAKFKLPTELAVGKYRIKAKVKGKKISAKKKFTVYSGGIQPNATAFTYSMSTGELFNYSGTVTWKGKPGSTGGWVDIYKAPYTKGISGPDYLCMDAIEEGGTFDFTYKSCFTDFVPGTYEVRAFYTPTAGSSADDYLIGTPITVTIVP